MRVRRERGKVGKRRQKSDYMGKVKENDGKEGKKGSLESTVEGENV